MLGDLKSVTIIYIYEAGDSISNLSSDKPGGELLATIIMIAGDATDN